MVNDELDGVWSLYADAGYGGTVAALRRMVEGVAFIDGRQIRGGNSQVYWMGDFRQRFKEIWVQITAKSQTSDPVSDPFDPIGGEWRRFSANADYDLALTDGRPVEA
jgi:hypothetical protein